MMVFWRHLRNILFIFLSINIIFGNWDQCNFNLLKAFFHGLEAFPYLLYPIIIPFFIWYAAIQLLNINNNSLNRYNDLIEFLLPFVFYISLFAFFQISAGRISFCLIVWPIISITVFYLLYRYMNRPRHKAD